MCFKVLSDISNFGAIFKMKLTLPLFFESIEYTIRGFLTCIKKTTTKIVIVECRTAMKVLFLL
jgi:hypothetical protein